MEPCCPLGSPGPAHKWQTTPLPTIPSPSLVTFACPHPLGVKTRTQPGFTSSVPTPPPAYCRHSGCFRTQPAAPGKLKLAFSTPPQWADTGSQRDAGLNPEPTTKQDKISINKLDPRSLIWAGQGAGCWRWLGAAVSAADTAGAEQWCRWQETPPGGQHSSRAGQVSQLAPSHPTCQSWLVYLGLFSVKGQGPKGRSGQKLALCCPLVAY